jgi:hypothetical protein
MGDGEKINEGRFPHPRSRVALTVEVGLYHRSRVTPGAPRRPSDHRVAFHQPYQGRHTGRTRGYGARSCTSSTIRVRYADAERVKRLAPPQILASVEENPTRCAGKRSHPKLWPSSRFGHEADHLIARRTGPEPEDDQRFGWQDLCGAPRRNRTGDPILTIDAQVVHNALQHLAWPRNRAGGRR